MTPGIQTDEHKPTRYAADGHMTVIIAADKSWRKTPTLQTLLGATSRQLDISHDIVDVIKKQLQLSPSIVSRCDRPRYQGWLAQWTLIVNCYVFT